MNCFEFDNRGAELSNPQAFLLQSVFSRALTEVLLFVLGLIVLMNFCHFDIHLEDALCMFSNAPFYDILCMLQVAPKPFLIGQGDHVRYLTLN